jgi:hypothetical protein
MDSSDREVRLQASLAACALFMHGPIVNHTSTASVGIIDEVVRRLIRLGLADPGEYYDCHTTFLCRTLNPDTCPQMPKSERRS